MNWSFRSNLPLIETCYAQQFGNHFKLFIISIYLNNNEVFQDEDDVGHQTHI